MIGLLASPPVSGEQVASRPLKGEPRWDDLSPNGLWILQQVAFPIALGLTHDEVASRLGRRRGRWIVSALQELADELVRLDEGMALPSRDENG